jgi:hypothetical protein
MGHAPTNPNGSELQPLQDRINALAPHQFGKPGGSIPANNGRPATSKQRQCMEAIQNLEDLSDAKALKKIAQRFSPGMVRRFVALQRDAEAMGPGAVQSQRLIREILLVPNRREKEAEDGGGESRGATITLLHGHTDVQLPGSAPETPEGRESPGQGAATKAAP